MIYINFVVLQTLMLYAKFQGNWPSGSGEEFFKVLSIFEHGGQLGHVTEIVYINFRSPFPRRLHMKFGFDWSSGFRGEDVWKMWTDDDNGPCSPCEPEGSGVSLTAQLSWNITFFSPQNYHFYSREMLQYIARTCLGKRITIVSCSLADVVSLLVIWYQPLSFWTILFLSQLTFKLRYFNIFSQF